MKRKSATDENAITFAERVVCAFVSAVVASLTVLAYFFVNLAFAAKAGSGMPLVVFIFSKFAMAFIGVVSVVGFLLGSERMAGVFGVLWGTHEVWEEVWFQRFVAMLVCCVLAGVAVHFIWP